MPLVKDTDCADKPVTERIRRGATYPVCPRRLTYARGDLLCMPEAECLNVVRIGILAHSNLLIPVTCDHMTVARRQNLQTKQWLRKLIYDGDDETLL